MVDKQIYEPQDLPGALQIVESNSLLPLMDRSVDGRDKMKILVNLLLLTATAGAHCKLRKLGSCLWW